MSLAQWCQTHSLQEFLELLEENFNRKDTLMNAEVTQTAVQPEVKPAEAQAKTQATPVDGQGKVPQDKETPKA